jgi:S-DNA-T family DNA segregation ATPase FtsK/SpoIIIE
VEGISGESADRAVDVGSGATVDDVIDALGGTRANRLAVTRTGQLLDGTAPVAGADIRSGDSVALVRAGTEVHPVADHGQSNGDGGDPSGRPGGAGGTSGADAPGSATQQRSRTWRPAAMLKILTGPSAPATVEIAFGETTLGRGTENDVVILDDGMSRMHASLIIDDDSVEIVDRSSTNGVVIGGRARSERTALTRGTRALLGKTWIEVEHLQRPRGLGDLGQNTVEFNRPPRMIHPYEPAKFELPVPPDHPPKQRIPKISAIAPLFLGAGMIYMPVLLGGRPNYLFGMFMLFSPVMLLGSFFENRSSARANFRDALEEFNNAVTNVEQRLETAHVEEQEGRRRASPAPQELEELVETLSRRLWERGLNDSDGLSVRIGLADQPSQNKIETHDRGPADLRAALEGIPERFAVVAQVPAVASLRQNGGIGVSGPQEFVTPLCYSIVGQLATLHTPAELLISAMIPESARSAWEWLKWLPHCPIGESPLGGHQLAANEVECRAMLARLLAFVDARREQQSTRSDDSTVQVPAVVVVIGEGVPVEQHELTRLLETGPAAGVFVVWVSGSSSRVPRAIGNVVQVDPEGRSASLSISGTNRTVPDVVFETMDERNVTSLARRLTPIEDISARFSTGSQIPSRVSLVELLGGVEVLDSPEPILEHWQHRPKTLEAPVGRLSDGLFTLDIRRDGPHALVGGTTGAGKSEFLQSWVMSLAATHSPETVTFLLVDYKGGAAFKDCSKLPHTVGMVTDLDKAGVRRALVSLIAELHRREHILAEADCSDLLEMIDKKIPHTPPSLLIIVDEFAALVQEVPEFVEGMVGIAQRGRSLGLHLVLATQRPAGIITGQVKSNTDLRIALRMADGEDSVDVIDSPAAAEISRAIPGRAVARISRDRFAFQSAYVGGKTGADDTGPSVELGEFHFGGVQPIASALPAAAVQPDEVVGTDLERLVENLCNTHTVTGKDLPRKPWLAPLEATYDVSEMPQPADDASLLLGMVDVPDEQAQIPLYFNPDVDGSLGIIGGGGSGKTVALRTICAAAALHDGAPDNVPHIYCMDFAGRGMRMVESLPHVGGVALDDDPERLIRILSDIQMIMDERARKFSDVQASSLGEYRQARPDDPTNRVYLLIDGYPSFHEMFEPVENERWIKLVRRVILEGRQVGVHVVLTAPRREAIYSTIVRAMGRWLILRQTSVDDYRSLEVPDDLLGEEGSAGRAIENKNVAQVAILGGETSTERQAEAIRTLADKLIAAGVPEARPVKVLPPTIAHTDLVDAKAIGIRDRDFGEQVLPDRFPVFLVSGPRASGKSTTLSTVGRAIGGDFDEVIFFAPKPPSVPVDPSWKVAAGQEAIEDIIYPLLGGGEGSRLLLIDDAYTLFENGLPVDQLVEACDGAGMRAVISMEDTRARSGFDPFARSLTAHRFGLMLRPSPLEDADIYGVALPRIKSHLWPAGRGYLVSGHGLETLQIAT